MFRRRGMTPAAPHPGATLVMSWSSPRCAACKARFWYTSVHYTERGGRSSRGLGGRAGAIAVEDFVAEAGGEPAVRVPEARVRNSLIEFTLGETTVTASARSTSHRGRAL